MWLRLPYLGHMVPLMGQTDPVSVGLADVVAKELTARGYTTLRSRAAVTNIKPSTLDRYLKAERPFKITELAKVADALGMSLSELAGAAEEAA